MGIVELLQHSGPVAVAVLGLLVIFSVFSWAIILFKWWSLRTAHKSSQNFIDLFWKLRNLSDVFERSKKFENSPVSRIFQSGYEEILNEQKEGHTPSLEHVEHALRRAVAQELAESERMIPFLATVGSTSPFIGLFGTVVGIMNAFKEIGSQGSASLATVAPGIAEALVATAAGLLAAIPAVIAYNYFSTRLRTVSYDLDTFSNDFLNIVKKYLANRS